MDAMERKGDTGEMDQAKTQTRKDENTRLSDTLDKREKGKKRHYYLGKRKLPCPTQTLSAQCTYLLLSEYGTP